MIKYHYDIQQGTEEWHQIRLGRVGGTSSSVLLSGSTVDPDRDCCPTCNSISLRYRKTTKDYYCNGCKDSISQVIKYGNSAKCNELSEGAWTLIDRAASEIITGYASESYSGAAMERGHEMEPIAKKRYVNTQFVDMKEIGYVSNGDYLGFSPDGVVGSSGLVEIKSPEGPEFTHYSRTREIKGIYQSQMQWALWVSKRDWCDFVVYHPDFPKDIIITRIYPDPAVQARFKKIVPKYLAELKRVVSDLKN